MPFRQAGSGVDLDFIPLPDNVKFTGRRAPFPADPVERFVWRG